MEFNALLNKAVDEMKKAGLPVTGTEIDERGFDFVFSVGLTEEQQARAQKIAAKYIKTDYSFCSK